MSDNKESDTSSSYSSDGEVITLFKRTTDSPPSSDADSDPDSQAKGFLPSFPLGSLGEDERNEILQILESPTDKPEIQIFPSAVRGHVNHKHAHIVSRLSELPGRSKSVVLATRSLQTLLSGGEQEKTAPKGVLCDICVFSPKHPVLLLTIATGTGRKDRLVRYNSQVIRQILQHVRRTTRYSFNAVYGVVEDTCCHTRDDFVAKVKRLEQDAQVMSLPRALVMTQNKCLNITRSFLQLLPCEEPTLICANVEAKHEEPSSHLNLEALLKRIEQLELGQAEARKEKEEMKGKYEEDLKQMKQNFLGEARKEKKEMKEKYEEMHEELQQLKQNYLTDVRLHLLMRPRSSSVSESTTVSGYGSTEMEVDMDIAARHADGGDDTGRQHQTEGQDSTNIDQTVPDSELSKEDIYTGDTELVKYNRDITLHQACEEGKLDVVKYILTNKIADINCRGKAGRTPVMLAALKGQVAVFDFLVSNGCDMSTVENYKETILHVACVGGNIDIVKKILVARICGIENRGGHGRTPVMTAVRTGHKAVFEFLVSQGCSLSAVADNKDNVLHWASMGGNTDIVRALLDTGKCDIEGKGSYGRTPVMLAAYFGHRGLVDYLVSKGSDLKAVDGGGDNVLHVTCIGRDASMVKYILSLDVVSIESRGIYGRTPVMTAAVKGNRVVFDFLVSRGSDLKAVDDQGSNILHVACIGGDVAMVKHILSLDVVSIESRGPYGRTPVMTAAADGKRAVFDFLVSCGSDLTTVSHTGYNILHAACVGGDVDIVKYLMTRRDVDKQVKNKNGETAVQVAERKGHVAVVSLLKAEV